MKRNAADARTSINVRAEVSRAALAAGLLVTATHVPLGIQVLKRGIVFIDLAIAQIAGCGVILADRLGFGTAWVAESHLSTEVQKTNPGAVIPHFVGEIGLNTDILQLAHRVFGRTKQIGVGSAIMNILCNGGPIAAAAEPTKPAAAEATKPADKPQAAAPATAQKTTREAIRTCHPDSRM